MSKIFLFASVLTVLAASVTSVNAQAPKKNQSNQSNAASYSVSPRELVSLGRHGRFKTQGIPSHNNFRQGVRMGRITAEELVTSAVAQNRLSADVLGDRQYLETVASHLKFGGCGS